jgi:hypothetical protein
VEGRPQEEQPGLRHEGDVQGTVLELVKFSIITKKSVNSVINERTILSSMKHP